MTGKEQILAWIKGRFSNTLNIPLEEVNLNTKFSRYGMMPANAAMLILDLYEKTGISFDADIFNDFPTLNSLVNHVISQKPELLESIGGFEESQVYTSNTTLKKEEEKSFFDDFDPIEEVKTEIEIKTESSDNFFDAIEDEKPVEVVKELVEEVKTEVEIETESSDNFFDAIEDEKPTEVVKAIVEEVEIETKKVQDSAKEAQKEELDEIEQPLDNTSSNKVLQNLTEKVESSSKKWISDSEKQVLYSLIQKRRIKEVAAVIDKLLDRRNYIEKAKDDTIQNTTLKPIAIVGMGCRFPKARNTKEFWDLMKSEQDAITEIPKERFDINQIYDVDENTKDKTNSKWGAFLDDLDDFDPLFFGISPREAVEISPAQKLALQVTWEAIEEIGIPYDKIRGSKTGVFFGTCWYDFERIRMRKFAETVQHTALGQSTNLIANRVSYTFGFRGPSMVVDTGCSASLVAIHLACQSLREGDSEFAIAGGVNTLLDPEMFVTLTKFGALSSDGKCHSFDAKGNGYVRGEGVGVVLLKTLEKAERDGDNILGVIRGSAVNNNGFNASLPATSVKGQKELLEDVYSSSGLKPSEIHYVEAHGTGTKVGDPVEIEALGTVLGEGRQKNNPLLVGSVKTNIGHQEGAAGVAGLIKVLLSMQHKNIPKSLNFDTPNPEIPFDELNVGVQNNSGGVWNVPQGETFKTGINSFGWGGTNAHLVVEEYPKKNQRGLISKSEKIGQKVIIFPISARTEEDLKEYAQIYADFLKNNVGEEYDEFYKICATAAIAKPQFTHRLAFVGENKHEIIEQIEAFLANEHSEFITNKLAYGGKLAFIFPGQGAQRRNMGKTLFASEKVFRDMIQKCDRVLRKYVDWSLIKEVYATQNNSRLEEIDVIQPATFAIQISLATLMMSWGVKPKTIVGHSMGEVSAAYIAGILTLDDAAKIICHRSKLMKRKSGHGSMLATGLRLQEAEELISNYPNLSIAVNNSPTSTVISGDSDAINEIDAQLTEKGIFSRHIKVDMAAHSPQLDDLKEELYAKIKDIKPQKGTIDIFSTVRNSFVTGKEMDANYWLDNLRKSVLFASAIDYIIRSDHSVLIEVSPSPILTPAIFQCAEMHSDKEIAIIDTLRKDSHEHRETLIDLAEYFCQGVTVRWDYFYNYFNDFVSLPAHPLHVETYTIKDRSELFVGQNKNTKHPLLGSFVQLAGLKNLHIWNSSLDLDSLSYLSEHKLGKDIILPASVYIEMICATANEVFGSPHITLQSTDFTKSISLDENTPNKIQINLDKKGKKTASFEIFEEQEQVWELVCKGYLISNESVANQGKQAANLELIQGLQSQIKKQLSKENYYNLLVGKGLNYGKSFTLIDQIWQGDDETLVKIKFDAHTKFKQYQIPPTFLDACFHSLFTAIPDSQMQGSFVSTGISNLEIYQAISESTDFWLVAKQEPTDQKNTLLVDMDVFDDTGKLIISVKGLKAQKTILEIPQVVIPESKLYQVNWEKYNPTKSFSRKDLEKEGVWIVLGEQGSISKELLTKFDTAHQECVLIQSGLYFNQIENTDCPTYQINPLQKRHFKQIFEEELIAKKQHCKGIIHCWGFNNSDNLLSINQIEESQLHGSMSVVHLLQALSELQITPSPRLTIITNGTQFINSKDKQINIAQAPLWGLSRVISNEFPEVECTRFDLEFTPSDAAVDMIFGDLMTPNLEKEIAIREEERYVPRLEKHFLNTKQKEYVLTFEENATYMITGGTGGIGFFFAKWLIAKGAKNIILISRSGGSEVVQDKIKSLNQEGANVQIAKADITNLNTLTKITAKIPSKEPLKGIFHAAAIIDDSAIINLDTDKFYKVLQAKVMGTWNLHELTKDLNLDHFVLFSSVATLLGTTGLANYVAANSFLDAFAKFRHLQNLPALSINWGVWENIGFAAASDVNAADEGVHPMPAYEYVKLFEEVVGTKTAQQAIMDFDYDKMQDFNPIARNNPFYSKVLDTKLGTVFSAEAEKQENSLKDQLASATSKKEQKKILIKYLRGALAKILKSSVDKVNPSTEFKSLGMDSLMTIQLRNRIKEDLDITMNVTTFWTYPSSKRYAGFLLDSIQIEPNQTIQIEKEESQNEVVEEKVLSEAPKEKHLEIVTVQTLEEEVPKQDEEPKKPNEVSSKPSLDDLANELDAELDGLLDD
jgi:myxalamid-type polyketide synthase MxaE and MxaD